MSATPPPQTGEGKSHEVSASYADGGGRSALEQGHDLGEGLVGDGFDLGLGAVLDGVRDVDDGGLEAQRIALRLDALGEFGGHDVDARQAVAIEVVEVVQTARCAGPSI